MHSNKKNYELTLHFRSPQPTRGKNYDYESRIK